MTARDRASRPEAKSLRLFVAVDVPAEVCDALATAIGPLRADFPKVRWVPPRNWHATLKFLGAVWPRLLDWVTESVGGVAGASRPFDTALQGIGAFPNERRARVLWASLADQQGSLAALAEGLSSALEREFAPEKRGFTAHLTIARFDPLVPLGEMLASVRVPEVPFRVDHLTLYRSHLRHPAPVYEALQEFPLGD